MVLLGLAAGTGCAHKEYGALHQPFNPLPPATSAPVPGFSNQQVIVTPETGLAGKVVKVNSGGRFVVLNFPVGHLPTIDQRLNVYHQGLKAGEVKISGPQLEDNVVGDLISGSAQVGDEVRDQ
jgi:hypothetical protein